jgi:hypothetical protein
MAALITGVEGTRKASSWPRESESVPGEIRLRLRRFYPPTDEEIKTSSLVSPW